MMAKKNLPGQEDVHYNSERQKRLSLYKKALCV